jgi:GAF domain-containing protein
VGGRRSGVGRARRDAAAFFAKVSRDLMREHEEATTLQRVAERAVEVVPAVDFVGISVRRRRRRVETMAYTAPEALLCDEMQYELDEGPCLEAIWENDAYLAANTSSDTRWPRWAPRVAEVGVGSVLSIRLATETETLGALNLYARPQNAFDSDDVDLAMIYASHATNAMSAARLITGLQTAVQSRHRIGVAQGILMHRYDLTLEHSFEVLRRYSSDANIKVHDLATAVVENHCLPELDGLDNWRPEVIDAKDEPAAELPSS